MGSDGSQFGLDAVTHLECVNEVADALGRDGGICACESFEGLVGVRISFSAEYGLYSFGAYCPAVVEVAVDGVLIEQELAQSLECRLERYDHVAHRHTNIAQHR